MSWFELSALVPSAIADDAAALLVDAGAAAVEIRDDQFGMGEEDPVPKGKALLRATYENAPHTATQAEQLCLKAKATLQCIGLKEEVLNTIIVAHRHDENWREAWKQFFTPIAIHPAHGGPKLWVLPPWQQDKAAPDDMRVIIDPGMAFGTGHHETTRLCLQLLVDNPPQGSALDMGCGSGILSIASVLLGAQEVHATDIDPEALSATLENACVNACNERVHVESTKAIKKLAARYDVVIANILAPILCDLSNELRAHVAPGGQLILSGIPLAERSHIVEHFAIGEGAGAWGVRKEIKEGEWLALLLERNEPI